MRRLAVVAAVVLLLTACGNDGGDGPPPLVPFIAPDRRFSALLPLPPKRSERDVSTPAGNVRLVTYTSQVRDDYGFSVGWYELSTPPAPESVRPFLESTQRGGVTSVEGELTSSEYIEFGARPGIEYTAKMKAGPYLKARTIISGKDVYVLQMITRDVDPPQYKQFVDGFLISD